MLMAENYRTGFVWDNFMKNREARRAMKLVGFRPTARQPPAGERTRKPTTKAHA